MWWGYRPSISLNAHRHTQTCRACRDIVLCICTHIQVHFLFITLTCLHACWLKTRTHLQLVSSNDPQRKKKSPWKGIKPGKWTNNPPVVLEKINMETIVLTGKLWSLVQTTDLLCWPSAPWHRACPCGRACTVKVKCARLHLPNYKQPSGVW